MTFTAVGKTLPPEVIEQIRLKTDGVPLFVEEVTKTVIESVGSMESLELPQRTPLQLVIPATLQEALLARLDRLSDARQVAQLGATLGREFSYELLHAISPLNEADLRTALAKLVEAEILYQRGVGEQSRYFFKHALIQDTAYQSLLKSTRQQYHQQIAQILEERFLDIKINQPEMLAYHYTEANLIEQAIPYRRQAGQIALRRSANVEAIDQFSAALELLSKIPETPKRAEEELSLLLSRAAPLIATQGYVSPAVRQSYERARALSEQVTYTPQLFRALWGLAWFHTNAGENLLAQQLVAKCLTLAEEQHDPSLLLQAHFFTGGLLHWFGELSAAESHLKQAIGLYEFERDHTLAFVCGVELGMASFAYRALNLWYLGYPAQALQQAREAVHFAERAQHPLSQCFAIGYVALVHFLRGEAQAAYQQAIELSRVAEEQLFQHYRLMAMFWRGVGLVEQGNIEEGREIALAASAAMQKMAVGSGRRSPTYSFLAELSRKAGHPEEGLDFVDQGLRLASSGEDMQSEAELHRLKGELTLQRGTRGSGLGTSSQSSQAPSLKALNPSEAEAEACFLTALEVSRKQQAKSLELRAATSLARLWQQHGKTTEAYDLLAPVYNWFTEGFDTTDLKDAKALLDTLSEGM